MSFYVPWQNTENETFVFKDTIMNNSKSKKILGVTIGNKRTFSSHIRELCKKGSQNILALSRISNQLLNGYEKIPEKQNKQTNKQNNKKSGSKMSV